MSGRVFPIVGRSEVVSVSSQARREAREFGLGARRSEELGIVVAELASNIVKHGIRGEIVLARDVGPPIRDLKLAMTDHHDDQGPIDPALLLRRGGLGTGLGAVARFADRVEYHEHEGGKTVTARFFR